MNEPTFSRSESDSSEVEVELSSSDSETHGLDTEERLGRMVERMIARCGLEGRLEEVTGGRLAEVSGVLEAVRARLEEEGGSTEQEVSVDTVQETGHDTGQGGDEGSDTAVEIEPAQGRWVGRVVVVRGEVGPWLEGVVKRQTGEGENTWYHVQLKNDEVLVTRGELVAGAVTHPDSLELGSRVVAALSSSNWQSGTVTEPPNQMNLGRFLVFLDTAAPAYVSMEQVLRTILPDQGLEELPAPYSTFLASYLASYPYRKMVGLGEGQSVQVGSVILTTASQHISLSLICNLASLELVKFDVKQ